MGFIQKILEKVTGKVSTDEKQDPNAPEGENPGDPENPGNQEKKDMKSEEELLSAVLKKLGELTDEFNSKVTEMDSRIEQQNKKIDENAALEEVKTQISRIDKTLNEFSAVYELISNQYNPFLDKDGKKGDKGKKDNAPAKEEKTDGSKIVVEDAITGNKTEIDHGGKKGSEHAEQPAEEVVPEQPKEEEKVEEPAKEEKVPKPEDKPAPDAAKDAKSDVKDNVKKAGDIDSSNQLFTNQADSGVFGEQSSVSQNDADQLAMAIKDMSHVSEDLKKDLIDSMIADKQKSNSKMLIKQAPADSRFHAEGCEPFSSLLDLAMVLNNPESSVFQEHVGSESDHFSDWIEHALNMKPLADKLRTVKDKHEYLVNILSEV